ncbi:chitin-binding protein [Actinoplanes lutulentus]|uniref:Chitin-binding protein n=1 Tax=Actinoplanes lutulentus TaxID=1287878 RepID=A0A327Z481_9ACTN|nr:lytic polysaccharide monooxygenase [Actinoplanes lutulentus]MBB2943833.1 chitin-binding protein [Actinoplanes lutulentus]RAK29375.1 chitin-binding protein [Actinoplanes lutulentus]
MYVRLLTAAGLLTLASVPALPAAALAHGSPVTPISRTAACGGNGSKTSAAACVAARKATGGRLGAYDNLRLANVNGNDRERVPDGELCSGGIALYKGLDLARDDFPSTDVKSGQRLSVSYRGTIPHEGSFRIYLTKAGYDPATKLTWDALGSKPLADIKDPPLTDGAYRMKVTLPERTGRQILYVVWETSSTPDTYYSCSDLEFGAPVVKKAVVKKTTAAPVVKKTTAAPVVKKTTEAPAPVESEPAVIDAAPASADTTMVNIGHWLILGALTAAALVAAGAGLSRARRRKNS